MGVTTFSASRVTPRILSFATKKNVQLELLARVGVAQAFAHMRQISVERACTIIGRQHPRYNDEIAKICRASTSPATTFDEGWAVEFVVAEGADLIMELMPLSAFAQLAGQGMHLTFGVGDILVPNIVSIAPGVFVRQGDPIPVVSGQTTGQMLTRKKMACIVAYTGEMNEGAIEPFEGILRTRIQEATSVALDTVLLDDQPASDVRPAGLLSGAVEITTTGALGDDLQSLAQGLFTAANDFVRAPVLIMNSAQAMAAKLHFNYGFIPIIVSSRMAAGTVLMVDAADFACAGGRLPRFDISREAAIHFEDTTPDHLHVGIPIRSLWQEELLGLRMILEVDWCLRRPGVACFMRNVHWRSN